MKCAWKSYLELLPFWLRDTVDRHGKDSLEELRLRLDMPAVLHLHNRIITTERKVSADDLQFCINVASRYSPWASDTMSKGYITAQGGHRIGICGTAVIKSGKMAGIRTVSSLCIRVARDYFGIASAAKEARGSVLIIGKPGSGKTTFLRDMIRQIAESTVVSVVDEREEIFPKQSDHFCFSTGQGIDVISGCPKAEGVEAVLRAMGPGVIAVDEITATEDCKALLRAGWCGVRLLATAHAANADDLYKRPVYKPIVENKLFDSLIVMRADKTWYLERMVT